jgi:hypothetical protein
MRIAIPIIMVCVAMGTTILMIPPPEQLTPILVVFSVWYIAGAVSVLAQDMKREP